jgi:5-methylcytosine-specific restriction protein A
MTTIKRKIAELKVMASSTNPKYRANSDEVIKLFTERKIEKFKEAEKLLTQLSSRGKAPQSAINKIKEKYIKAEPATGKLTRPAQQEYFISGTIEKVETYKQQLKKKGITIQSKEYLVSMPYATTIKAKNKADAQGIFSLAAAGFFSDMGSGEDSNTNKTKKFKGATINSIEPVSNFKAEKESSQMMRASSPIEYSFIPADTTHLKNTGFCVLDQFIGVYGPVIKHMTADYFIDLCYKVRGESRPALKEISALDRGIEGIEDDSDSEAWSIKDGVSPEMLKKICEHEDISHYCFDITRKSFSKFISRNRNYKALVYYCVNNHMYYISDRDKAEELIKKARDVETKIKSHCIQDDEKKTRTNIYTEEGREVLENIAIDDLNNYTKATIIYSKSNLNEELDQIIEKHHFIPEVLNQRYTITQIKYTKDNRDIILVVDPNLDHNLTFKDVRTFCNNTEIEFTNQSFSHLIKQLKTRFLETKTPRHQATKEERLRMLDDADGCCASCKKEIKKAFDIDHIIPLAEGGTNEPENLQVLCKPCHFEKTQSEQERGYIKLSQTESSFNSRTKEIFNSSLNAKHAFVEKLKEEIPTKLRDNKIHFFDKVRCRKNAMYFNEYDYPLFTVIDEPVFYKGEKKTGLYFVQTTNYLPMRGNGWYSLPMVMYCLENKLIKETDIRYALYSSLSIPKNYYNKFIDYLYNIMGSKAKLSVNSMIGCFKPKVRENWRSLLITTNPNVAYAHFLDKKGCFIDTRHIGDDTYYQVYDRYFSNREETEAPIYNQILEQEAIELHKLIKLLQSKGGVVLDVSTDCVSCVFKTDESPFELDGENIRGYYDDKENKHFKYRKEDKEGRLQVERMKLSIRTDYYDHQRKDFNILPDTDDFKYLVDTILNSKQSIHIDGRAGCGKTTLIKMIQKEMNDKDILYKALAPTNKACRLIDGETMHRFSVMATSSYIRETKIKYIFIDEVSMMPEMFYKFFIVLKRMRPDIKFIIAGDFAQLLPVKDRVENCDYKNSLALFELCDGNRLELTKCRRSDATLFNMLLPENINKITREDFKNELTTRHISFTNKKRIETNHYEMEKMIKRKKVKPLELKKLAYDPNSQDVMLCAGMPIISRKNNKELNIYNNETYTIKAIKKSEDIIIVADDDKEQEVPIKEFVRMFNVAFCITCHKAQGATFDEPYTIHEFNQFDERLKYVALSRATDISLINII